MMRRQWLVRGFVVVMVVTGVLARGADLIDLLAFGSMPRERSIVFMAVDSVILDLTWGVIAWRWWGR